MHMPTVRLSILMALAAPPAAAQEAAPGWRYGPDMMARRLGLMMFFGPLMMILFVAAVVVLVALAFRWLGGHGLHGRGMPQHRWGRRRSISSRSASPAARSTRPNSRSAGASSANRKPARRELRRSIRSGDRRPPTQSSRTPYQPPNSTGSVAFLKTSRVAPPKTSSRNRVPVGAHHQQLGTVRRRSRQQDVAGIAVRSRPPAPARPARHGAAA